MSQSGSERGATFRSNSLNEMRKQHIENVLRAVGYNRQRAAALLEVTGKELNKLMRQLGIVTPRTFSE